jgi:ATP synthase protein I
MDPPSRKAGQDPDPDGDRRRIDELDARLKAARGSTEKPSQGSGMSQRQTNVAYRVLVDMIAGLLVGGFLGYWLDRWWGTRPYMLVAMTVVGFAGGMNNAWRAIRSYAKDAERDDRK